MDYTSCSSAIILKDSIFYYKPSPLESTNNANEYRLSLSVSEEIFKDTITYGITAANANNKNSSRVKNCLNNEALHKDLQEINDTTVRHGFCFLDDGSEDIERGFVVSVPQPNSGSSGDSTEDAVILQLAKKYRQTYFYRFVT